MQVANRLERSLDLGATIINSQLKAHVVGAADIVEGIDGGCEGSLDPVVEIFVFCGYQVFETFATEAEIYLLCADDIVLEVRQAVAGIGRLCERGVRDVIRVVDLTVLILLAYFITNTCHAIFTCQVQEQRLLRGISGIACACGE